MCTEVPLFDVSCVLAIHGDFTNWSDWTGCDQEKCTKFRTRLCENPVPQFGGKDCSELGVAREEVPCIEGACKRESFSEQSL